MSVEVSQVRALAQALVDTIGKMPVAEKIERPTQHFGKHFNMLVKLAKEVSPDVDERLWPAEVKINDSYDSIFAHYVDLEVYARQILGLLPAKERQSLSQMQAAAKN